MKQAAFILLVASYLIWPACQHPNIIDQIEPVPVDTTQLLTCEDTIETNLPGTMEHGIISAVKTCRDFVASGKAFWSGPPSKHLSISGKTYFPYILTNGDTVLLYAEGLSFFVPKKMGTFPMISVPGLHTDTATCFFNYINVDVLRAGWLVDHSFSDNAIEITELDMVNKRVKGRFKMHMTIDPTLIDFEDYPARLYFHGGAFDLEILE